MKRTMYVYFGFSESFGTRALEGDTLASALQSLMNRANQVIRRTSPKFLFELQVASLAAEYAYLHPHPDGNGTAMVFFIDALMALRGDYDVLETYPGDIKQRLQAVLRGNTLALWYFSVGYTVLDALSAVIRKLLGKSRVKGGPVSGAQRQPQDLTPEQVAAMFPSGGAQKTASSEAAFGKGVTRTPSSDKQWYRTMLDRFLSRFLSSVGSRVYPPPGPSIPQQDSLTLEGDSGTGGGTTRELEGHEGQSGGASKPVSSRDEVHISLTAIVDQLHAVHLAYPFTQAYTLEQRQLLRVQLGALVTLANTFLEEFTRIYGIRIDRTMMLSAIRVVPHEVAWQYAREKYGSDISERPEEYKFSPFFFPAGNLLIVANPWTDDASFFRKKKLHAETLWEVRHDYYDAKGRKAPDGRTADMVKRDFLALPAEAAMKELIRSEFSRGLYYALVRAFHEGGSVILHDSQGRRAPAKKDRSWRTVGLPLSKLITSVLIDVVQYHADPKVTKVFLDDAIGLGEDTIGLPHLDAQSLFSGWLLPIIKDAYGDMISVSHAMVDSFLFGNIDSFLEAVSRRTGIPASVLANKLNQSTELYTNTIATYDDDINDWPKSVKRDVKIRVARFAQEALAAKSKMDLGDRRDEGTGGGVTREQEGDPQGPGARARGQNAADDSRKNPGFFQRLTKKISSGGAVEKEYKALRSGAVDPVPYPPRIGVVDRVSDQTLITGYEPDQRVIDCNVVILYGQGKAAMVHVSPQTMPDEYVSRRVTYPHNTNVDERLRGVVEALGRNIDAVHIIAGDDSLARQIRQYLTGGENVWGKYSGDMLVEEAKIQTYPLGTTGKEVIADTQTKTTYVADYTRGTYEKFPV